MASSTSRPRKGSRSFDRAGGGEIHVDLTHVREFHDFGVALLARELARHERTRVSGLRQHHLRLLRYLGLDAGAEDVNPAEAA